MIDYDTRSLGLGTVAYRLSVLEDPRNMRFGRSCLLNFFPSPNPSLAKAQGLQHLKTLHEPGSTGDNFLDWRNQLKLMLPTLLTCQLTS